MRILGIDIGSKAVKAVEIDSAFGRFEIQEYHQRNVLPGMTPAQTLAQLVQSLAKEPDRIAMALPNGRITYRTLSLPTRDKKALQSGVRFELEDELPLDSDATQFDYAVLKQDRQGSELYVAATTRGQIVQTLEELQPLGVDPDLITTEGWAFRGFFNRILAPENQEKPILLVHIGHESTLLYLHYQQKPIFTKEINWGGKDINLAICQKYQIPIEQAESAKLDHGFIIPLNQEVDVTPDQIEFSNAIRETMMSLIFELKQADLSAKGSTGQISSRVYISGGTSLLPGLVRVLEEELRRTVLPIQALTQISSSSGVKYSDQADAVFLPAIATALCLVGQDKAGLINFRKGAFAKAGRSLDLNISISRGPILWALSLTFVIASSLFFQKNYYAKKMEDVDAQLERGIKGMFGQMAQSAVRSYLSDQNKLKASITKEMNKQRELNRLLGPNPTSPLEFLKTLSSSVSKDVIVDMTVFKVGSAPEQSYPSPDSYQASLTFLVSNPGIGDSLNQTLGKKLTGIQKSKPEEVPSPDKAGKKWKITFTGKPTEDAYGSQ